MGSVRDLRRSLATETLADEAAGATTAAVGSFTFGEQDLGAIREALARLVAQGFVQSQAFTGFRVTGLSPVDLQELTDARADLEGLVLRRSVEEGDLAWGSQVLAGHTRWRGQPCTSRRTPIGSVTRGSPRTPRSTVHSSPVAGPPG